MGRKKGNFTTQPDIIKHTSSQKYNNSQQPQQLNNQQQQQQQNLIHEVKSNENEKDPDRAMVTPEGLDNSSEESVPNTDSSFPSGASKTLYESSQGIPCDNEGHIPHMTPLDSQDLYAIPVKRVPSDTAQTNDVDSEEKKDPPSDDALPSGWEKHEDNDGPYYWHIKSGTITRTPPNSNTQVQPHAPLRVERRSKDDQMSVALSGTVTRSNTSSALSELSAEVRPRNNSNRSAENAYKYYFIVHVFFSDDEVSQLGASLATSYGSRPIRFAVRSLGWVEIAEEDLTPERSSKAVNRCIVDLSVGGRRDVLDVVGRWGDGKDLFMDLDEGSLKLVDPENLTLLNTQPIHTIRVWGVGRDNGRTERWFGNWQGSSPDKLTNRTPTTSETFPSYCSTMVDSWRNVGFASLSFLGIGQNVKHCAFIMHTAQDQFIAHVFYCEPSSGALCKTIEAACKELWSFPAERDVIPHRHLSSPSGGTYCNQRSTEGDQLERCPFDSRQVQALVSPTCDSPRFLSLSRSPTTPALAMSPPSPMTPMTPMSPLDALKRLQTPVDISPQMIQEVN
ncbi:Protein Fe65-like protein [Armadillidium vulgare]|nr:Protein Fe65-like protein [Armadillidium vulgare]